MSAFVVQDATINRVVSFLFMMRDGEWLQRLIKRETGWNLLLDTDREAMGKAMFALNCNAVNQRYGENQAREFRDLDYSYSLEMGVSPLQAHKSLGCWLYQCSEGDIPDTSLLYATMQRVKGELADNIVSRLPEYDKCKSD